MAANGINAVRTYTAPPVWLLDAAQRHGLYVLVGLPWEQHIAFLDTPGLASDIEERVRRAVRDCGGHAAVLAYVIGNEIPAPIVRWHGARRIEKFLHRLYRGVKAEAPDTLATYVNFPTTEYLQLPFLDFCCFNVYLERHEQLEAYLAQLQNVAGDRPLVMAEVGLDSRRHGEINQAEVLGWQIRTVFAGGCSGVFLFAWTDEWYRGGYDIEDWDFGLTRRNRQLKPALAAVRTAFQQIPFPADVDWPRMSVVVCTCNGSGTIRDTLDALENIDYPDYEVIVVDDGSTDNTAKIALEYRVRVIRTPNRGLSAARNTGMEAARGGIIAYTDDDAFPDRQWLKYLAWTFLTTSYVGVGGPNITPAGDGAIAQCVAHAPGGPVHVLISAQEAEHIPGCNCAFRKEALEAVGGFDPIFRAAGDDVDLCWRLMERGRSYLPPCCTAYPPAIEAPRFPSRGVSQQQFRLGPILRCSSPAPTDDAGKASTGPVLRISSEDLSIPGGTRFGPHPIPTSPSRKRMTLDDVERKRILAALEGADWIVAVPKGAAARLGIKRSTLQSRMQKLGIQILRRGA